MLQQYLQHSTTTWGSCYRSRLRARLIGKLACVLTSRDRHNREGVESKHPTQEHLLMYLTIWKCDSNLKKYITIPQYTEAT